MKECAFLQRLATQLATVVSSELFSVTTTVNDEKSVFEHPIFHEIKILEIEIREAC